jgi:hypothetical protein
MKPTWRAAGWLFVLWLAAPPGQGLAQGVSRPPVDQNKARPATTGTVVRPPEARRAATAPATATRIIINVPQSTPSVALPAVPGYRASGYANGYGPPESGAGAYAGLYGYPGYGYSSSFGSPVYGYGAYASYYGFPGYNMIAPSYVVNGYGGAYYGPGVTPSLGFGANYGARGLGAYGPGYSW